MLDDFHHNKITLKKTQKNESLPHLGATLNFQDFDCLLRIQVWSPTWPMLCLWMCISLNKMAFTSLRLLSSFLFRAKDPDLAA